MSVSTDTVHVLHVDDDAEFLELAATALERGHERLAVRTATGAEEAIGCLEAVPVDCIVSDYEIPGQNGIELLQTVRETHPELPFILYTGKGSEAVASDAISTGVTDYLQKDTGTDQFELLANRITNAVERSHARQEVDWHRTVIRNMGEGTYVFDPEYVLRFVSFRNPEQMEASADDWVGRPLSSLIDSGVLSPEEGEWIRAGTDRIRADEADEVRIEVEPELPAPVETLELRLTAIETQDDRDFVLGTTRDITARKERERELKQIKGQYQTLVENFPDGAVFLFDTRLRYVRTGGNELNAVGLSPEDVVGSTPHELFPDSLAEELAKHYREALAGKEATFEQEYAGEQYRIRTMPVRGGESGRDITYGMAVSQNVTERRTRERRLERQNERLEEFAGIVSHDLRNPLNVAEGRLELAREEPDGEHIEVATDAIQRSQRLIDDLLTLAREGRVVGEVEPVALSEIAEQCWRTVATQTATLDVESDRVISADRTRLQQLLENLIGNAVEHAGSGASVTVGNLEGGFYVADDGPGVDPADREAVFEAGRSTAETGTGFGLRIVERIAEAHGWTVQVTESAAGGARFEITGVEFVG